MTFKFKDVDQTITIYNLRADTNEFIGAGDAYIPANTGLPAYCTDIEPPETGNSEVAAFDSVKKKWTVIEDHRDTTVYDVNSGSAIYITLLGPLPENTTYLKPNDPYQKWDGKEWVDDVDKKKDAYQRKIEEDRQALLSEAKEVTADWRTELLLDDISDSDKALLTEWMVYIKQVKALDTSMVVDEVSYTEFSWPPVPQ